MPCSTVRRPLFSSFAAARSSVTSPPRASWRTIVFVIAGCTASLCAAAQNDLPAGEQAKLNQRAVAIDALRQGEFAKADALLLAIPTGSRNSTAWHLDYASQLMAAAIDLQDRNQAKLATDYFHRAATELQAGLNAGDLGVSAGLKSRIYETLGFIARVADSDGPRANAFLKQAVVLDPENPRARAALQRTKEGRNELDALDAKKSAPAPGK